MARKVSYVSQALPAFVLFAGLAISVSIRVPDSMADTLTETPGPTDNMDEILPTDSLDDLLIETPGPTDNTSTDTTDTNTSTGTSTDTSDQTNIMDYFPTETPQQAAQALVRGIAGNRELIATTRLQIARQAIELANNPVGEMPGNLAFNPGIDYSAGAIKPAYDALLDNFMSYASAQHDQEEQAKAILDDEVASYSQSGFSNHQAVTAQLLPTTWESVEAINQKYRLITGGVVLEGTGGKLPIIVHSVALLRKIGCIVINERLVYPVPVSFPELQDIFAAEQQRDEIGVSTGFRNAFIYGPLQRNGLVAKHLFLSDQFLGELVFDLNYWTAYYRRPSGVTIGPAPDGFGPLGGVFAFSNTGFAVKDGVVTGTGINLTLQIIPMQPARNAINIFVPDQSRINAQDIPDQFRKNGENLAQEFDFYQRERLIRAIISYAEVADFARLLRRNGVDLRQVLANAI